MINLFCPKPDAPSGGVWFIHRLASLAAQLGLPAQVIQTEPFQVWWDAHPIAPNLIAPPKPTLSPGDTMIFPEVDWSSHMAEAFPGTRVILFLQNYIWLNEEKREACRRLKPEIMVCSRFLYNWCTRELGVKPVGIVRPYLDPDVWQPTPKESNRVLLYSRRNVDLANSLALAISEAGFPVDLLSEPRTQVTIQGHLNRAEFYVHHVEPEGFPMAALEAQRSGVIPVGTTGGGGNEFMFNDETALVTPGPLLGHYANPEVFVKAVVVRLERLRGDAALREKLWKQGYEWSKRYTAEATMAELAKVLIA